MDDHTQTLLQRLPAVDRLLERARQSDRLQGVPHAVLCNAARTAVEALRHRLLQDRGRVNTAEVEEAAVMQRMEALVATAMQPNLRPVINATGTAVRPCLMASEAACSWSVSG